MLGHDMSILGRCLAGIVEKEEGRQIEWKEGFSKPDWKLLSVQHNPQSTRLWLSQRKKKKGAIIPIKNREGFYPQPLQPHSSCDVEAVGFRSTNSCQRACISSRSRKTGLTASQAKGSEPQDSSAGSKGEHSKKEGHSKPHTAVSKGMAAKLLQFTKYFIRQLKELPYGEVNGSMTLIYR